jgi:hypothetical protein
MEINSFAEIYFDAEATQDKLHAALSPIVDRYLSGGEKERIYIALHRQVKRFFQQQAVSVSYAHS